jgi:hypothetical protein
MANHALVVLAAVVFAPAIALAQAGPLGPPAPPPPAPTPAPSAAPPASVTTPATGFAPSNKRSSNRWHRTAPAKPQQPDDALPGFEELSDGGSRFFVELQKTVPIDEQKAPGSVTYVMHGMQVKLRNNRNALVTVHFNTPAFRARLVPHAKDTMFVIELRANVQPTWRIVPGSNGTSVLQVDFPKGDYLSGAPLLAPTATAPAPPPPPPPAAPPAAPAPTAH